jgi:hypothetical protein
MRANPQNKFPALKIYQRCTCLWQAAVMALAAGAVCLQAAAADSQCVSLAGTWRFQLDSANAGISGRWFERTLPGKIKLPGSLPAQGIGDAPSLDT